MLKNRYYITYKSIVLTLFGLVIILISGFRPLEYFSDTSTYIYMIHNFDSILDAEPAFWIINQFNKLFLGGKDQIFFLLFSILGVSLKILSIKRTAIYPYLSLYLYICLYLVLHEMTQIRVGVAGSIFMLAIPDIAKKNPKKYFLKALFAVLFHYSAIIMVVLYFIDNRNLNKKLYFILPIIGLVIAFASNVMTNVFDLLSFILPSFISNKIVTYLDLKESEVFNQINIFNLFTLSLVFIYYFLLYKFNLIKSELNIVLIKLFSFQIFIYYAFSSVPVFAGRLSEFLGLNLIFLIPNLILLFRQKAVPILFIIVWGAVYFWVITINTLIVFN